MAVTTGLDLPGISIFIYGSLLSPEIRRCLLGRAVPARRATLHGYRRVGLHGLTYPGLVADSGASTAGAVILLTPREIAILDRYEGAGYRRRRIRLDLGGRVATGWTYVLAPAARRHARTGAWSSADFMRRHAPCYVHRLRGPGAVP